MSVHLTPGLAYSIDALNGRADCKTAREILAQHKTTLALREMYLPPEDNRDMMEVDFVSDCKRACTIIAGVMIVVFAHWVLG